MTDLMAMDISRATELRQRMETAANGLDWDAQALQGPLIEAEVLLQTPVPTVELDTQRIADELRQSAQDLQERTRMVVAGGPEINEALGALEQIREHFTMIESRGEVDESDGLLSRRDLRWAARSADEATAAAADWLLRHDRYFDQIETAKHNDDYFSRPDATGLSFDPKDRDGLMSRDDIDAYLDKTAARTALASHGDTIDGASGAAPDGYISRAELEAFVSDYDLTAEEQAAVRTVLDDGAYHSAGGGLKIGTVLDVVSFIPVIGDVVDTARAVHYALNGDFFTAGLFALSLVPLPGLSASGVRGAVKVVQQVTKAAKDKGVKEAGEQAANFAVKGTAANFAAHEGAKQAGGALGVKVDLDESVDYVVDDVVGERLEDVLDEDLDPRLKRALTDRFEQSLEERLSSDAKFRLAASNTMIARRVAEHQAISRILRRLLP
ncbi:MAG: hypothetical protein OXE79_10695 [Acidimicrobiaceae bacterium]|nr:hypothetical protein [Acidimicrobiaceae bacterium]MCY4279563.1 hypothetical protein [Acidimicrobiaceae bacterium]MCY4295283.1 hypothetical protein [Acidimicrobiaceae bacterium]